jgi:SAM-dependent methyltransferase
MTSGYSISGSLWSHREDSPSPSPFPRRVEGTTKIMSDYKFENRDFEKSSFLFILEDKLKNFLGGPLLYNPYIKSFGIKGNERILDFGCGGGISSRCIAKKLTKGGFLTCVDTSKFWMKKAKKRLRKYNNVELRTGDIRELDIPDSSYDIVSIVHVIHDIGPELRQATVNSLAAKPKEGGRLFIVEPTKKSHGMPPQEIWTLMNNAGLVETNSSIKKSSYAGEFTKPDTE